MSDPKLRCEAMVAEGIEDPESQEGIRFCTDCCPYECCVVFENAGTTQKLKAKERAELARALFARGVSRYDLALIVGKNKRTVAGYLKRRSNAVDRTSKPSKREGNAR